MLQGHDARVLHEHLTDPDELAAQIGQADVLVLMRERTPVTAALLDRLPGLQMISQISDVPHIDLKACTQRGVLVSSNRFPGAPAFRALHATAELTWALALSASRRLPAEMRSLREGRWQSGAGWSLRGRTLGVFGYGRIGSVVAGYGRAFGMKVLVWGREASRSRAQADGHAVCESQQQLFECADVLTLHLRLNAQTRHIVGRDDLARMKPDALLVNTSRAGLIAPGALVEALRAGCPGGAAIDVFDEEPMTDSAHPMLALDNLICTPHIGYVERGSLNDQYAEIFGQIFAWQRGEPVHVANPEVLPRNSGPLAREAPTQR
mgnify:CR=1 FL=1